MAGGNLPAPASDSYGRTGLDELADSKSGVSATLSSPRLISRRNEDGKGPFIASGRSPEVGYGRSLPGFITLAHLAVRSPREDPSGGPRPVAAEAWLRRRHQTPRDREGGDLGSTAGFFFAERFIQLWPSRF